MTWNVTSFVDDLMIIELNFTNSSLLSLSGTDLDKIQFAIKNNESTIPKYFLSEDGYPLINMTLRA